MSEDAPAPPGDWSDRVAFSGNANRFAYNPHQIIVAGEQGRETALRLFGGILAVEASTSVVDSTTSVPRVFTLFRVRDDIDPLAVIRQMRTEGVVAQPNHVLFAHGDVCCPPHPAWLWQCCFGGAPQCGFGLSGSPLYGSPLYGSPLYGSPLYGSPLYGSPLYGSPVYGSPEAATPAYGSPVYAKPGSEYQITGMHHSSAVPCPAPILPLRTIPTGGIKPRIVILDTGLAEDDQRPHSLDFVEHLGSDWQDAPDAEPDGYLDPAVGHGTFIAGLINSLAPGCEISIEKVLSATGEGCEWSIARAILGLDPPHLLNLSFGGYALWDPYMLQSAIDQVQALGTVVVASAGNDATCRPCYPAAFNNVIAVAALGPGGPAGFSNYGDWVRACAPGVDLVSTFFTHAQGPEPAPGGYPEPDMYLGWARWSGTSFSGPVVVAALAREMQCYGLSVSDAVACVIDAPGLCRIPLFGTAVDLQ